MITDSDYDMLTNEVNFRYSGNLSKYDVQEFLDTGNNWNLEPWEAEAIRREAQNMGI